MKEKEALEKILEDFNVGLIIFTDEKVNKNINTEDGAYIDTFAPKYYSWDTYSQIKEKIMMNYENYKDLKGLNEFLALK
jgi:hypothetical protein